MCRKIPLLVDVGRETEGEDTERRKNERDGGKSLVQENSTPCRWTMGLSPVVRWKKKKE